MCLIFETLGTSQKLKTHVKCSRRLKNRELKEVERVRLKICLKKTYPIDYKIIKIFNTITSVILHT